jgi:hypothetical protein
MVQGNLSTVDRTLVALWWMDDLTMLTSPTADAAFGYLLSAQRDDGGWDEDPAVAQYSLPPWIHPGDLKTRLYLSAYSAYWLAAAGYGRGAAFRRALAFLARHQDGTGKFHGYLHTTWIASAVFCLAGPEYSDVAGKGLQILMDRPIDGWEDSQIAWALDCLGKAGLPREHPFVEKGLAELCRRRESGGSWSSEDGEAYAVAATIGALKALKLYGTSPARPYRHLP